MGKSNSRISQTPWVCAVPKVMQNITAEPFDLFEVKINYPLQYPDIITRVGESSGLADHKSKPEELSQTHRFTADSAEIDYVKKNGEYLNDFDSDEEITEEERLHFPVWRGPDYEENDIKPYLISNLTYFQQNVFSEKQENYLSQNSKFRIKVLNSNRDITSGDLIKVFLVVTELDTTISSIILKLNVEGHYISDDLYIVEGDTSELSIDGENTYEEIDGKNYRVFHVNSIDDVKITIKKDDKKVNCSTEKMVYSLYNLKWYSRLLNVYFYKYTNPIQDRESFTKSISNLADSGYTSIVDKSPTMLEFFRLFQKHSFKMFYFTGHGLYSGVNIPSQHGQGGLQRRGEKGISGLRVQENFQEGVTGSQELFDDEITDEEIKTLFKSYNIKGPDILFINACNPSYSEDFLQYFLDAFGSKLIVGWNDSVDTAYAIPFFEKLFKELSIFKKMGKKTISWNELIESFDKKYESDELMKKAKEKRMVLGDESYEF